MFSLVCSNHHLKHTQHRQSGGVALSLASGVEANADVNSRVLLARISDDEGALRLHAQSASRLLHLAVLLPARRGLGQTLGRLTHHDRLLPHRHVHVGWLLAELLAQIYVTQA